MTWSNGFGDQHHEFQNFYFAISGFFAGLAGVELGGFLRASRIELEGDLDKIYSRFPILKDRLVLF